MAPDDPDRSGIVTGNQLQKGIRIQDECAVASTYARRRNISVRKRIIEGVAAELVRANVGDLRRTDEGAVIHVRGKGGKDRRVPIESALVQVLERYLDGRAIRFPATAKRRSFPGGDWPPGRRRRRCSWVRMATASPAAPCNTGCCARFVARASRPTAPAAPSCMGCATPSPPSWPTPTSASTP